MLNIYYDRNGHPTDAAGWERAHAGDRHVGLTKVASGDQAFTVSTVWLGIDHSFGSGPPQIFETMVFPEGGWGELDCERYSTEREALAGHRAMVAKFSATLTDPVITDGQGFDGF